MRSLIRLIFLTALCSNFALAEPLQLTTPEQFGERVRHLRTENEARAVIAGVWVGKKPLARIALGTSMTGVPATTDMSFRIGGVSQTFLGTLVMKLVEEGHFSLDDKISRWLPDLLESEKVTVGMLLNNTAGYKDYVRDPKAIDRITADPFAHFSAREIVDMALQDGEMNFSPGKTQEYSHTEFTILGQVMEKATGKSMPTLYEEYLLEPLQLERTGYSTTAQMPEPVLHSYSTDRDVYEESTFWDPSWAGESGPLYSTLDDLGKWGPIFGKGEMLSSKAFQTLLQRPAAGGKDNLYFAAGFVVANDWYFQNPNINGYTGVMGYLPEKDLTLVVFATRPDEGNTVHPAFAIFQQLVKELTPEHPLPF